MTFNEEPRPCSCGAAIDEQHHDWCDIARCAATGQQLIQCAGEEHEYKGRTYGEHEGACESDRWTGFYPGTLEAVERGWFSVFHGLRGWVRCGPDDPDARPDLNRVHSELHWNPATQRYEEAA